MGVMYAHVLFGRALIEPLPPVLGWGEELVTAVRNCAESGCKQEAESYEAERI